MQVLANNIEDISQQLSSVKVESQQREEAMKVEVEDLLRVASEETNDLRRTLEISRRSVEESNLLTVGLKDELRETCSRLDEAAVGRL